ncbi:MAG: Rrf2 family transcriptional regulator [Gammaproteobacteria bacterium]|nr:Rrf2 family transcriptional regulator [Gammaproteobacteria bacterium]
MKLSTKARYAITAMMELALNENKKPTTLADISEYQKISLSYLEQLFAKLRAKGLVRGVRGPGGGYHLAVPAAELSIARIVAAINDEKSKHDQLEVEQGSEQEVLESMWDNLSHKLYDFLEGISLQEMVDDYNKQQSSLSVVNTFENNSSNIASF